VSADEARRYHHYRPSHHHIPFGKLRALLGHEMGSVLDLACGTGHSTTALFQMSKKIVGCDISSEMLTEARKHSKLEYIEASAEQLPFADDSFDLLNVSLAMPWIDADRFLEEAKRVLKTKHHLSVDHYAFSGKLKPDNGFEAFYKKFQPEATPAAYPPDDLLKKYGFRMIQEIPYKHKVNLDLKAFTHFLMTQTCESVAEEDAQKHFEKLSQSFRPFFENSDRELLFSGILKLYQMI
jgi:ubiquinone/menaquinone biosynthesis C-methylase UbiE